MDRLEQREKHSFQKNAEPKAPITKSFIVKEHYALTTTPIKRNMEAKLLRQERINSNYE